MRFDLALRTFHAAMPGWFLHDRMRSRALCQHHHAHHRCRASPFTQKVASTAARRPSVLRSQEMLDHRAHTADSSSGTSSESEDGVYASAEEVPSDGEEAEGEEAEEHCDLTSESGLSSEASSRGVGSIYDAEQSEASAAEDEVLGAEVCSACSDDNAEAVADTPGNSDLGAAEQLRLLLDATRRARAERLRGMRDAAFLEWQAERAAARRAASGSPASGPGSPAATSPAGASLSHAGASPSHSSRAPTPTLATVDFALERPRALPLLLADDLDERRAQVAELVQRDPRAAVWLAHEIFRRLPTMELPAEADRVYARLAVPDETVERSTTVQPSPAGPPRTLGARRAAGEPFVAPRRVERCSCCDAQFGDGESARCPAVQMLAALADDLAERDATVERELDQGYDEAGVYRAARWFLYRQCIALQYGHLGRGVRIKLPDCVVGAIRSRWREPSCTCETIAELAVCRRHGYTGFRAA